MTLLNGILEEWDLFIRSVTRCSKFPQYEILWEDCIQEEERLATKKCIFVENLAVKTQTKRCRGKKIFEIRDKYSSSRPTPNTRRKTVLSQIQCSRCDKFGHEHKFYPTRKGKQHASTTDVEERFPQKRVQRCTYISGGERGLGEFSPWR